MSTRLPESGSCQLIWGVNQFGEYHFGKAMVSLRRNSTVLWMCALLHWHDPREWQQWQDRYPGSMSTTTAFVLTPVRLDLKLDLMPLDGEQRQMIGQYFQSFP